MRLFEIAVVAKLAARVAGRRFDSLETARQAPNSFSTSASNAGTSRFPAATTIVLAGA
jgi:hypothetical protein